MAGVSTVEVATGDVATLYEGPDTFRPGLGLAFAPWPEARNGGIWVSPTTDESTRYNLDGESVASVPGWGSSSPPAAAGGRGTSETRPAMSG